jgi:hypothetical protein
MSDEKYRAIYVLGTNKEYIHKGNKKMLKEKFKNFKKVSCRQTIFDCERKAQIYLEYCGNISQDKVEELFKQEQDKLRKKVQIRVNLALTNDEKDEIEISEEHKLTLDEFKKIKNHLNLKIHLDENAIYCDAGDYTSLNKAIKVTNSKGKLLFDIFKEDKSEYEVFQYFLRKKDWKEEDDCIVLNNYGNANEIQYAEAIAMYFGLEIAIRTGAKVLYADNEDVIKNWSKGLGSLKTEYDIETVYALYKKRQEFEKLGGVVKHIYGEINPADFGKHRKPSNCKFVGKNSKHITIDEYERLKKIYDKIDKGNSVGKKDESFLNEVIKKLEN